jgi:voltage-gated potassium channel
VISFILNTLKLLKAIWHGIRQDEEFRILFVSLFTIIAGGTVFYWQVEGWSVIDSLYFCFMTMSTIGYGDLVPTTSYSKLFTIVFSVLTIGMFAAIVSKLVLVIVKDKSQRKMRKSSTHDVTKNE